MNSKSRVKHRHITVINSHAWKKAAFKAALYLRLFSLFFGKHETASLGDVKDAHLLLCR
jgi:hypothetical protein